MKVATPEERYTLAEAKRILDLQKHEERCALWETMKNKLLGGAIIALSIITPFLLDGDATVSLFMLPLGGSMMFIKEED